MNPDREQKTPEAKFLEAYEAHADAIFRFCFFKLGSREKARDIAQDVFTKAWEYVAKGHRVQSLRALLYRIARNAIIDEYRRKKSLSLESMEQVGLSLPDSRDYEARIQQDDARAVVMLLKTLEPIYQDVLVLRYIEDLSVPQIAKRLGVTENVVSVRIHRATAILRGKYEGNTKYGTI